jgi:pimeloyl-ACP methyl ester carboxylesterase
MTTYVLVHGSWHGSWCWKRVRRALQAAGHDVHTPTLTGFAERSHLNSPDVNLSTHILDVVNLIRWEELSDVVLCGHSYGGAVISGATELIPERIRSLVYLDAFVLENGECVFDLIDPDQAEGMRQAASSIGEGWKVPPIPAEVFQVNSEDRGWVDAQCTPQSLACLEERLVLKGGLATVANVTHVRATGFEIGSPFGACHDRAKAKKWKTTSIACGHDAMLDAPEELTALLKNAAK